VTLTMQLRPVAQSTLLMFNFPAAMTISRAWQESLRKQIDTLRNRLQEARTQAFVSTGKSTNNSVGTIRSATVGVGHPSNNRPVLAAIQCCLCCGPNCFIDIILSEVLQRERCSVAKLGQACECFRHGSTNTRVRIARKIEEGGLRCGAG
jgi:hypothetical protein